MIILPNIPLSEANDYVYTKCMTLEDFNPIEEYINLYESLDYEMYKASQSFYLDTINESSLEVLNESFSNFIEKIKLAIKKIKEFILSLIDKFISLFKKKEKTIKLTVTGMSPDIEEKLNKALKDANASLNKIGLYPEKDNNRYVLNDSVPVNSTVIDYAEDVLDLFKKTKGKGANTSTESRLAGKIKANKDEVEKKLNLARGRILNKSNPIKKEDFEAECNKIFIKGKRDFESENFIKEALEVIKSGKFEKEIKELEKKKKEIYHAYDGIAKALDEMMSVNIDDGKRSGSVTLKPDNDKYKDSEYNRVSVDTLRNLESMINKSIAGVNELASNHAGAFSIKLTCYKNYYMQCSSTVNKMKEADEKLKEENKKDEE